MSDVSDFFALLSSANRDRFIAVANDMLLHAPEDKIRRLLEFQAKLKSEIDHINRRREALGSQTNNVRTILDMLDNYEKNCEDPSFEVVLLRSVLESMRHDLQAEVSELRPTLKLEKKADVTRKREVLAQRKKISEMMLRMASEVSDGS